jgi:hypothetical protein
LLTHFLLEEEMIWCKIPAAVKEDPRLLARLPILRHKAVQAIEKPLYERHIKPTRARFYKSISLAVRMWKNQSEDRYKNVMDVIKSKYWKSNN